MTCAEMKTLIIGPIATAPAAFDESCEIDYGLMAAATERWIEVGLFCSHRRRLHSWNNTITEVLS